MTLAELHEVELPEDLFGDGLLGGPLNDPLVFAEQVEALVGLATVPVEEASLVVPEGWLRLSFSEADTLPRLRKERDEMLRWTLKRLVPFRVEELRVSDIEVEPLPSQEETRRVLIGFGVELFYSQLEDAFSRRGIHVGRIVNRSLAILGAVGRRWRPQELTAIVSVSEGDYGLLLCRGNEPLLHRYKPLNPALEAAAQARFVTRDLNLTRVFVEERVEASGVDRVMIAAPEEREEMWSGLTEDIFRCEPTLIEGRVLSVEGEYGGVHWPDLAPMLGAAALEIS